MNKILLVYTRYIEPHLNFNWWNIRRGGISEVRKKSLEIIKGGFPELLENVVGVRGLRVGL